jgi:hypothetical protein
MTEQRQAVERGLQGVQGLGAEEVGEGLQGARLQDEAAVGWGDGQDSESPHKDAWKVGRLQVERPLRLFRTLEVSRNIILLILDPFRYKQTQIVKCSQKLTKGIYNVACHQGALILVIPSTKNILESFTYKVLFVEKRSSSVASSYCFSYCPFIGGVPDERKATGITVAVNENGG